MLLTETIAATGLGRELATALAPWSKPLAVHDPATVITDLAVTLALGGDCLADIALLRAEPGLFGPVASDATVSRTIDVLAKDAPAALKAVAQPEWPPSGCLDHSPNPDDGLGSP